MNPEPTEIDCIQHDLNMLNQRVEEIEKIVTKVKRFLYADFIDKIPKIRESSFVGGAEWACDFVCEELSYVKSGVIDIDTAILHIANYCYGKKSSYKANGETADREDQGEGF